MPKEIAIKSDRKSPCRHAPNVPGHMEKTILIGTTIWPPGLFFADRLPENYQKSSRFRKVTQKLAWTPRAEITNIPEFIKTQPGYRIFDSQVSCCGCQFNARKNNETPIIPAWLQHRKRRTIRRKRSFPRAIGSNALRGDGLLSPRLHDPTKPTALPGLPSLSRLPSGIHASLGHDCPYGWGSPSRFSRRTATCNGPTAPGEHARISIDVTRTTDSSRLHDRYPDSLRLPKVSPKPA